VITTAGDDHKSAKARELGADYVINHYQQKISDEVRKITSKEGVDIVLEHVGPATWDESVRSLKPAGTLVTCGATSGPQVGIDLRFVYSRQLSILGSYMGTMGELYEVLKHVFSGTLKPVVDRSFPLKDARAAHEYMEKSAMFRKNCAESVNRSAVLERFQFVRVRGQSASRTRDYGPPALCPGLVPRAIIRFVISVSNALDGIAASWARLAIVHAPPSLCEMR
jgi:hypothetical protein